MNVWKDTLALALARLGVAGLSPRAPGTVGSAVAALASPWLFLPLSLPWRLAALAAVFAMGWWAAGRAERILGVKDPGSVVIDELAGQWIVLLPLGTGLAPGWWSLSPWPGKALLIVTGFCLFRLFDIWKPGPVRASENWLPGGGGVMLDDVVAGLFGLAIMVGICALLPGI